MITLKSHYKLSAATQATAVSLAVLIHVKKKDGTPVFNTQQQVILEKVAMGVGCVAAVIHFSAHARLVVRGVKGIAKMVTK